MHCLCNVCVCGGDVCSVVCVCFVRGGVWCVVCVLVCVCVGVCVGVCAESVWEMCVLCFGAVVCCFCVALWCWCVVCVRVCVVCVRCVCVLCVWRGLARGKPPVCRFKTSPCVGSKRLRVYRQNARMCSTCARFASTHGGVLNLHTETF